MRKGTRSFGHTVVGLLLLCVLAAPAAMSVPGASEKDIATWRARRFGMFITWGPVTLKGTKIGWSRGKQVPLEEYDNLYKQFNPVEFDADEWVRVAEDAGMKYMVITAKHHDGFCLWPSKYTDYHIGNTPFSRDVLRELSAACQKRAIAFGTYYCVADFRHPDYPSWKPPDFPENSAGGKTYKPNPNLDRYIEHMRNQVTELIENYGPLSTMWFDCPRLVFAEHGIPTIEMVRKLQPGIMINERVYMPHTNVGDYSTPEQIVGGFDRVRPWETCMTLCGPQWSWKPKDDPMKSLEQCVQILLFSVGGDGNLLLNVGPMPDGRIEPRQVERLREMGKWVKKYGDGIHGTRGGPFKPDQKWGVSTCKGNEIYLFVMKWPDEGPLRLPAIAMKIKTSKALSGGKVAVRQTDSGVLVDILPDDRADIATVIKLTVDGDAFEIEPVDVVK